MKKEIRRFFGPNRTVFEASAPGRLDVMGGFGDYSGSWVLQMPIAERTTVFLAWTNLPSIRIHSSAAQGMGFQPELEVPLRVLGNKKIPVEYEILQKVLQSNHSSAWAAYVIGCFAVLLREKGVELPGADIWIESNVPFGKGVSSSAAIEVAAMTAICESRGLNPGLTELPILAQKVENFVVGAPCGLMDQLTSHLGEKDRLLPILCQPDRVAAPIDVPNGIRFVGIDSGVRHAVSGASYTDVRTAAFMGYSLIASLEGATREDLKRARKSGDWSGLPYGGFLANIPPSIFETRYKARLPERMKGRAFLEEFGRTTDAITKPSRKIFYAVRPCVTHPVHENHRVRVFSLLLEDLNRGKLTLALRREHLEALGEMMYQAHAGYTACRIGNEVTDAIVEAVRAAGPSCGVHGAKITGGGSGGSVCVLCEGAKGVATAKRIAREISDRYGHPPLLLLGSSDGARKTGVKRITT